MLNTPESGACSQKSRHSPGYPSPRFWPTLRLPGEPCATGSNRPGRGTYRGPGRGPIDPVPMPSSPRAGRYLYIYPPTHLRALGLVFSRIQTHSSFRTHSRIQRSFIRQAARKTQRPFSACMLPSSMQAPASLSHRCLIVVSGFGTRGVLDRAGSLGI